MLLRFIATVFAGLFLAGCLQEVPMHNEQRTAEWVAPVDAQLDAYNAHDVDTLGRAYAEQVEVYIFPQTLICSGREQLRQTYEHLFAVSPQVRAELLSRQVKEPFVVDHERVSGLQSADGSSGKESLVIYRIEAGTINAVWFLP